MNTPSFYGNPQPGRSIDNGIAAGESELVYHPVCVIFNLPSSFFLFLLMSSDEDDKYWQPGQTIPPALFVPDSPIEYFRNHVISRSGVQRVNVEHLRPWFSVWFSVAPSDQAGIRTSRFTEYLRRSQTKVKTWKNLLESGTPVFYHNMMMSIHVPQCINQCFHKIFSHTYNFTSLPCELSPFKEEDDIIAKFLILVRHF